MTAKRGGHYSHIVCVNDVEAGDRSVTFAARHLDSYPTNRDGTKHINDKHAKKVRHWPCNAAVLLRLGLGLPPWSRSARL